MKKTLVMLLILVMLLSLCACSSDNQTTDPSDFSQATTEDTEKPTDGTEGITGATQAPTDEPTTVPTDEPTTPPTQAPTEAPTTPPTQAPTEAPTTPPTTPPTTCSHSWKDATCTSPKTCSKCGATEGNAAEHNWSDATCTAPKTCSKCGTTEGSAVGHSYSNGTCSVCGTADPSYKKLTEGAWVNVSEDSFTVMTFAESGSVQIKVYQGMLYTVEEFTKTVDTKSEYFVDEYAWYEVHEIDGVQYVGLYLDETEEQYTVNGTTVVTGIYDKPVNLSWDGYAVTVTDAGSSGWLNNGLKLSWSASGYKFISDAVSFFK